MSYRRNNNATRRRSRSAERYRGGRRDGDRRDGDRRKTDERKRRGRTPSESSSRSRRQGRSYSKSSSSRSSSKSSKSSLLSELSAAPQQKPLYLRLANLSRNVTPSVLTEILSHFGDLRSLDFVPHHPGTSKLKGVAYARFSTAEEARAALECLAPGTKSSPEKRGDDQEEERKESKIKDTEEKQASSEEEASEKESDEDSKKSRKEESKDQDKVDDKEEQVTWIDGRKIVVECLDEKLAEDLPKKKKSRSRSRARPVRSSRDRRRRSPS